MKKGKYIISRDSIYIGTVIKTNRKHLMQDINNRLKIFKSSKLRNIIFTPNIFGYANDLLYASKNYPILNMAKQPFSNEKDEILLIIDAYNLNDLLNYLGYQYLLNHKDIIKIRKTLFNGNFTKLNSDLFGWQEISIENLEFYRNGIKVTDPKEIEKQKWQILSKKSRNDFIQTFIRYNEQLKEFEHIIDSHSDNSIIDVILNNKVKINSFIPHPNEGKIKKLK